MKKETDETLLINRLKEKVSNEFAEWTITHFYPHLSKITIETLQEKKGPTYSLFRDFVAKSYVTQLINEMTIDNWYGGVISFKESNKFSNLLDDTSDALNDIDQLIPDVIVGRNFPYETINMLLLDCVNVLEVLTREENFSFCTRLLEHDFDYNTFSLIESIYLKEKLVD